MVTAYAEVNHGRWIAMCPACIYGAELIDERNPTSLHCLSCGATSTVILPDNLKAINAALAERPDPATRNWLPGETVDVLHAENIENLVTPQDRGGSN